MKKVSDNVNAINDDIPIEIIIAQNDAKLSDAGAELTKAELTKALKNMKNEKSPSLDGFTVDFFKFFWTGLNIFYSIDTRDIQNTYVVNIQRIRTKA